MREKKILQMCMDSDYGLSGRSSSQSSFGALYISFRARPVKIMKFTEQITGFHWATSICQAVCWLVGIIYIYIYDPVHIIVPHWLTYWNQDVCKGNAVNSSWAEGPVFRSEERWPGLGRHRGPVNPAHRARAVLSTCLQSCVAEWREGGSRRWTCN